MTKKSVFGVKAEARKKRAAAYGRQYGEGRAQAIQDPEAGYNEEYVKRIRREVAAKRAAKEKAEKFMKFIREHNLTKNNGGV